MPAGSPEAPGGALARANVTDAATHGWRIRNARKSPMRDACYMSPRMPEEFVLDCKNRCKAVQRAHSGYAGLVLGSPPQLESAEADDLPLPEAPEPMDAEGPYVGDLQVERCAVAL